MQAAIALYSERGFEETTVVDIAERAGVTERTFFRYFTDKREVLFEGSARLQQTIVDAIAAAPADRLPVDIVADAMAEGADLLADVRENDYSSKRAAIIAANPSLQERELLKFAALGAAAAEALRNREVPAATATLAAEIGVTVFKVGFDTWIARGQTKTFAECIAEALAGVKALTVG
jgi:AcrR family transcriptional regulator